MTFSREPLKTPVISKRFPCWVLVLGTPLAVALLLVAPFLWRGNASGHDIAFHASSWLDAAGQWREAILYPRWSEWANYGFGEPRFIFYPPLSWMLGAALSLVLPGNAIPGAFIVLVQTAAGLSMFVLARRIFPLGAAVFSAACYTANPYALLIVYMRSDFAELLACAFLPALLLAALELCGLIENGSRSRLRTTAIFALLFAAIWLCNAPAGVLASYSMALLFAWAALRGKSLLPLLRGAAGLALGLGLACFYLLPAAYEQRWVNIGEALSSGLQPAQNFLYTRIADQEHNQFNWIASSVAVLLMAMTGIAALLAYRREQHQAGSGERKEVYCALLVLGLAAAMLMLRPTAILWEQLPKLRFVQFPWRWMAILSVPYACFGAAVVVRRRGLWVWALFLTLVVGAIAVLLVEKAWWDSDDLPSLQDAITDGKGFEGTDEYDPVGDDHYNLPKEAPRVEILPAEQTEESPGRLPNAQIHVASWTAEHRELLVDAAEPLRLAVRVLHYPAWRVEVNGIPVTSLSSEGNAQILLRLPSGHQRVSIRFARTPDRTLGGAISAVAGLALLWCLWASRARPRASG